MTATLRIVSACSLCGHQYASWSDEAAQDEHMAAAHSMHFNPGSLRSGIPPHWPPSPQDPP